jgi:hypothetical protein
MELVVRQHLKREFFQSFLGGDKTSDELTCCDKSSPQKQINNGQIPVSTILETNLTMLTS